MNRKIEVMKELIDRYDQLNQMKEMSCNVIIMQGYIKKLENELKELLGG